MKNEIEINEEGQPTTGNNVAAADKKIDPSFEAYMIAKALGDRSK